MEIDFEHELNAPQWDAVRFVEGPSLVIAGAGSGKTRVLTYKIAYLLEMGFEPWSILALTFTNKAANEMKQRIGAMVGMKRASCLWMGTFHSIFLHILRYEAPLTGYASGFTIYDQQDSQRLISTIIKEMGLDDKAYKPSLVASRISKAKNRLLLPEAYAMSHDVMVADQAAHIARTCDIYKRYMERCRTANTMDFDDILLNTFLLFQRHPEVCQKYADKFKYVLVDEYQDTNYAQNAIVWQLTKKNQRICVVGDDAQSIYSFRGANIDNILQFTKNYSSAKTFKLEQNYRSTQNIVGAAGSLINHNTRQIKKNVFSKNEAGRPIEVIKAYSDIEESILVVNRIRKIMRTNHAEANEFAVLYRTNAQSRVFEETIRKAGLPYRIYGGMSFYQRKEIKDVIAYFRLVVNPHDEEAFKRAVKYPSKGIGDTTVGKISALAQEHHCSMWEVITNPLHGLNVNKGTWNKLNAFSEMIHSFIEQSTTVELEPLAQGIIKDSGIMADLMNDASPEAKDRRDNVDELLNAVTDFYNRNREEGNLEHTTLADYLQEVSLVSDMDEDKGDDEKKVTLMTIHSAKGLEFGYVFVVGLEEGLFPNQMASGNPRELEEERRLFYVAITRAERECYLSFARSRYKFGKTEFAEPSRFLKEIDREYLYAEQDDSSAAESMGHPQGRVSSRPSFFGSEASSSAYGGSSSYGNSSSAYGSSSSSYGSSSSAYGSSRGSSSSYGSTSRAASAFSQQTGAGSNRRLVRVPSGSEAQDAMQTAQHGLLRVGQKVEHERFGKGIIQRLEGSGSNQKAVVEFQNFGVKTLLLKFVRFKQVE